jgi:hypothetical protein
MKKIIINMAVFALLLTACQKNFLDRKPLDAYSESTLWTSASDAIAAVNGCYAGWEDGYNIIYMDCASDNAYSQWPWEGFQSYGNGYISASDGNAESRWSYATIQRCNWLLSNIDKTPMDSTLKLRIKGEARFLRAYQYFIMSQLYGDVPLVTKAITTEQANTLSQTPRADIRKFILSELGDIAPDLPATYTGADVGRITKGAALSLKARIELYDQDYADCVTDCQAVMKLGVYKLFPSYGGMFTLQNMDNSGVILDRQYKENDNSFGSLGVMPSSSYGGWSSIDPTQSLVDAYEMINGKTIDDPTSGFNPDDPYKNRDPRLEATLVYPGELYGGKYYDPLDAGSPDYYAGNNNSKTGYLVKKFTANLSDFDDIWNVGLNFIVIRYAEVLLNYAEAKIELNQIDQSVYNAIDAVRNRAGMPSLDPSVYNDQSMMRKAVRRERRVEFAMEGLRWFDIQRWKIGDQVMKGEVYGARLGKVAPDNGKLTLTADRIKVEDRIFDPAKNYLWPVPQGQIDIDKNLKQNPGF